MNHKPRSSVVIEELRKGILTQASSVPIVQENTSQVDDISLPSHSGRIDTSTDDEPESCLEPVQHVIINTQPQKISHHSGRVIP